MAKKTPLWVSEVSAPTIFFHGATTVRTEQLLHHQVDLTVTAISWG